MRNGLWISAGAALWAAHFLAVYGLVGLACARGFEKALPWVAGALTAVALGISLLLVWRGARRWREAIPALSAGVAAFAMLAILWEAMPLILVAPCAAR